MEHDQSAQDSRTNHRKSAYNVWLLIVGLVGAYYLMTQHYAHVLDALPYALLLACTLMHLFMHHGHGGSDGHSAHHSSAPHSPQPLDSPKEPPAKQL